MTKKTHKIYTFSIFAVLVTLAICIVVSYAIDLSIRQSDSFRAATDTLTINSSTRYFADLSAQDTVSVYKTHDQSASTTISAFDLLVFTKGVATISGKTAEKFAVKNNGEGMSCYIFSYFPIGDSQVDTGLEVTHNFRVVVVPSQLQTFDKTDPSKGSVSFDIPNAYIASLADLRLINSHEFYNESVTISGNSMCYVNLFIITDIIIDSQITLTLPCYINLLYSKLTLCANLYIRHSYAGVFVMENTSTETSVIGGGEPADASSGLQQQGQGEWVSGQEQRVSGLQSQTDEQQMLNEQGFKVFIETPYAYYRTAAAVADELVYKAATDTIGEQILDDVLDAVCLDALDFSLNRLDEYIFSSVSLPNSYQNYKSSISFSSNSDSFLANGLVFRRYQTQEVTILAKVDIGINGRTKQAVGQKNIKVVGTDSEAITTSIARIFDDRIRKSYETSQQDMVNIYNYDRSIDTSELAQYLVKIAGLDSLQITTKNGGELVFSELICKKAVFSRSGERVSVELFSSMDSLLSVTLEQKDKIYLNYSGFEPLLTVQFSVGDSSVELSYNIVRTKNEVEGIIERYKNTPFIGTLADENDIYYIESDGSLQNDATSFVKMAGIFSIESIQSGVLRLKKEQFDALNADNTLLAGMINDPELDATGEYFDFRDGKKLFAVASVDFSGYVFVLWQKFEFFDGIYDDNSPFLCFSQIVVPDVGVAGGNEYEEYLSGDYFAENFAEAYVVSGDSIGTLKTYSGVFMNVRLTLDGATANYDFIKFASSGVDGGEIVYDYAHARADGVSVYVSGETSHTFETDDDLKSLKSLRFLIDIDKIPATSTAITFEVEFYYINSQGETAIINTEYYSFIVVGIYRRGIDFDKTIYDFMIGAILNHQNTNFAVFTSEFDGENLDRYVYVGQEGNYLLSNSASVFEGLFASNSNILELLGETDYGDGLFLTGIDHLTSLKRLGLEDVKIASLHDLTNSDGLPLAELSLSGCQITDQILGNNLAGLKKLYSVDLSGNFITNLSGILYRTVTALDISAQNADLDDITGLSSLYELITLDISNNKILSFHPLKDLRNLKTVVLFGNSPKNIDPVHQSFFGTKGTANLSVYTHLLIQGIKVFASNESPNNLIVDKNKAQPDNQASHNLEYLTLSQYNSAVVLNAIVYEAANEEQSNLPSTITTQEGEAITISSTQVVFFAAQKYFLIQINSDPDKYDQATARLLPIGEIVHIK